MKIFELCVVISLVLGTVGAKNGAKSKCTQEVSTSSGQFSSEAFLANNTNCTVVTLDIKAGEAVQLSCSVRGESCLYIKYGQKKKGKKKKQKNQGRPGASGKPSKPNKNKGKPSNKPGRPSKPNKKKGKSSNKPGRPSRPYKPGRPSRPNKNTRKPLNRPSKPNRPRRTTQAPNTRHKRQALGSNRPGSSGSTKPGKGKDTNKKKKKKQNNNKDKLDENEKPNNKKKKKNNNGKNSKKDKKKKKKKGKTQKVSLCESDGMKNYTIEDGSATLVMGGKMCRNNGGKGCGYDKGKGDKGSGYDKGKGDKGSGYDKGKGDKGSGYDKGKGDKGSGSDKGKGDGEPTMTGMEENENEGERKKRQAVGGVTTTSESPADGESENGGEETIASEGPADGESENGEEGESTDEVGAFECQWAPLN
ncbi:hypothetical protein SK128_010878 [Halocaridina rubra]|uniref:Uncharacterized protein n=1 Tax=Halocaridina rubra TaxID=373956 RepID=A0AAN8ZY21_HALRR